MILLLLLVSSMLTLIVVVHLLVCWKISPLIKILWFVISHHSVSSGANMSDHLPLSFQLHIPCASINTLPSSVSSKPKACINWSKVTPCTVMMYQQMVLGKLADPPVEFLQCSSPSCSVHLTTTQATLCLLFWIVLAVVSLAILHPNQEFLAGMRVLVN